MNLLDPSNVKTIKDTFLKNFSMEFFDEYITRVF
jgi:hypothetical protein